MVCELTRGNPMPKPDFTKHLIADTFKQLATKKHLDKISVCEIVEAARLNRQTFYYHFRDRQALIGWIFDADIAALKDKAEDGTLLDDVVAYMYTEKAFYSAALTSSTQNNLSEHMFQLFLRQLVYEISRLVDNRTLEETAILQVASFFANGVAGSLVQWAQTGMDYEYVRIARIQARSMKDVLAFSVNKCLEVSKALNEK